MWGNISVCLLLDVKCWINVVEKVIFLEIIINIKK